MNLLSMNRIQNNFDDQDWLAVESILLSIAYQFRSADDLVLECSANTDPKILLKCASFSGFCKSVLLVFSSIAS